MCFGTIVKGREGIEVGIGKKRVKEWSLKARLKRYTVKVEEREWKMGKKRRVVKRI